MNVIDQWNQICAAQRLINADRERVRTAMKAAERPKSDAPGLVAYRLPDGRVVAVGAGTSLPEIPYQLACGRVVAATRVRPR